MRIKTKRWEFTPAKHRKPKLVFYFLGWGTLQLGLHIDLSMLNIQIHLPFCFIQMGLDSTLTNIMYVTGCNINEPEKGD